MLFVLNSKQSELLECTINYTKFLKFWHFLKVIVRFYNNNTVKPFFHSESRKNVFLLNSCDLVKSFCQKCAWIFDRTPLSVTKKLPRDISLSRPSIGLQRPKRPRRTLEQEHQQQQVTSFLKKWISLFKLGKLFIIFNNNFRIYWAKWLHLMEHKLYNR